MAQSSHPTRPVPACAGMVIALLLVGCAGDRASTGTTVTPASPSAATDGVSGRWQLAEVGSSMCTMTFGGAPGAAEGTIAPEGGCPGNFFTSRKWTLEHGSLVIRDHNGQPLAQLTQADAGRYDGKAANGIIVTLTR